MTDTRDPLPVVALAIKHGLKKSDESRVTAALRLAEAKQRVEAGEAGELNNDDHRTPWEVWLDTNEIFLSEREMRFLLAVAAFPNPHEMVADERARARDGMRRLRAKRKAEAERRNVTPVSETADEPVAEPAWEAELGEMTAAEKRSCLVARRLLERGATEAYRAALIALLTEHRARRAA